MASSAATAVRVARAVEDSAIVIVVHAVTTEARVPRAAKAAVKMATVKARRTLTVAVTTKVGGGDQGSGEGQSRSAPA